MPVGRETQTVFWPLSRPFFWQTQGPDLICRFSAHPPSVGFQVDPLYRPTTLNPSGKRVTFETNEKYQPEATNLHTVRSRKVLQLQLSGQVCTQCVALVT